MDWFNLSLTLPATDPAQIFLPILLTTLFAPIPLSKLCIPHIIGMTLADLVIDKHGFSILVRDSNFELFGKVELYCIMSLAGLEMNMGDFKKDRGKAVILGLLAFIIPIGVGLVTNMVLLKYGPMTSVLLTSMYTSHTLVIYPIVIRYGISRHRSVSIAVGGTAVTDTLILLVLAMIGGLFKGGSGGLFWLRLVIKMVFLGTLIMYSFPRVGRWFFRHCDDNVMQFIFVLAMIFLDAGLMGFVGMEGILGTFLAGLVLDRLIPHVSPLMNHLEFVDSALFVPYSLIGVGMLVDIHIIFGQGDALEVAAVMITMALVGKWIASWLTQKIYKMAPIERELMFGLSGAQTATTLATVLVGYNIILPGGERLLNKDMLNGTILLILVTCVVSSFITKRATHKIAMYEVHLEEECTVKTEGILVPIASPDTVEYLVNLSLSVRGTKQEDNLLALNVINDNNTSEGLEFHGKGYLEKAAIITTSAGVPLQRITRCGLNIASDIIHTTKEHEATDVIIGLHRKVNIVDSFFGILVENLLKGLHREVMIAKFLIPINAIRRIITAVSPRTEYEAEFQRRVKYFCRMGGTLSCRVRFFANEETTVRSQVLMKKKCGQTLTDLSRLDDWGDLLILIGQVSYDHLLVVISARRGSVSYDSSFERLPTQLGKYFPNNSLTMLYPDRLGEPRDTVSFSNPRSEARHCEKVGKWVYKWFRES